MAWPSDVWVNVWGMMVTPTTPGQEFESRNRQADAVDRDGALVDHVAIQVCGHPELEPPVAITQFIERDQHAGRIHMPLHDVTG